MLIVQSVKLVNKVNKYSGFCSHRYPRFVPKCQFYSNIAETYIYQEFQPILPLVTASLYLPHTARKYGQMHFDEMEESHRRMLGALIAIILYHRSDN
jgi:hypothetical protein